MNHFFEFKRDAIAAVLGLVVVTPLWISGGTRPASDVRAGAPDAGTSTAEAATLDPLAAAANVTGPTPDPIGQKQTQNPASALPSPSIQPVAVATSIPAGTVNSRNSATAPESIPPTPPTTEEAPKTVAASSPKPDGAPPTTEPPPKPTAVEPQPAPVAEMSPEEIQRAIKGHRARLQKGRIRLNLDHSLLTPDQLGSVTAAYLLRTDNGHVYIRQSGQTLNESRESIPDDLLLGDFPTRQQWPQILAQEALKVFGPHHTAKAKFMLTDECALRMYRVMAEAVGDQPVPIGAEFVLRMQPADADQISVELVRYSPNRERTISP